jgi:hypothetical protein
MRKVKSLSISLYEREKTYSTYFWVAILVYDMMHEVGNRLELLQELHRVIKVDGILSVFPMHMGTDNFIHVMGACGLFCLINRYGPPGFKAASEVLNFNKC